MKLHARAKRAPSAAKTSKSASTRAPVTAYALGANSSLAKVLDLCTGAAPGMGKKQTTSQEGEACASWSSNRCEGASGEGEVSGNSSGRGIQPARETFPHRPLHCAHHPCVERGSPRRVPA